MGSLSDDDTDESFELVDHMEIDTAVLSSIAHVTMEALEPHEDEWQALSRHELVLASPNPADDVLETQRQFDAHRHHHVCVETQDPWESNRMLKGQLVDRNAMDLLLNIKGRLVTVPLNFVRCVRLPPGHERHDPVPQSVLLEQENYFLNTSGENEDENGDEGVKP